MWKRILDLWLRDATAAAGASRCAARPDAVGQRTCELRVGCMELKEVMFTRCGDLSVHAGLRPSLAKHPPTRAPFFLPSLTGAQTHLKV